jgi:hypothetical protein
MGLKKGDVVELTEGRHTRRGVVTRCNVTTARVRLKGNAYDDPYWVSTLVKIDPPTVDDLVEVLASGRYEAQQGHVLRINNHDPEDLVYIVDLDDEQVGFSAVDLNVLERIPTPSVREEGEEIKPQALQKGDEISVVITAKPVKGVSTVTTNIGVFDHKNSYGTLFTSNYGVLMNSHEAKVSESTVITLLKKAEDPVLVNLRKLPVGSVITWVKGKERRFISAKREDDEWSTMSYTKNGSSYCDYTTEQVHRFITEDGGKYEFLTEGP